jgi:shikimate kinase
MNWSYMQQGIVVWLVGTPELLARRVAKDGLEKRPLLAEGADAGAQGVELYDIALKKVNTLLADR